MGKAFSEKDIQFIKDNYSSMTDAEIAISLGRTEKSIETKRKRMGFHRSLRKYTWDDVLNAFSKTDFELISNESDYIDSATRSLRYICPNHKEIGIQTIALGHLLNGEGCRYCNKGQLPIWYLYTLVEEVNPNIEILENYHKITDRVKCRCKKHDVAMQKTIQKILKGRGCVYCGMEKRHPSYAEELICDLLDKWYISFTREMVFHDCKDKHVLPFDFFLTDCNVCIEYDGQHHYMDIYEEGGLEIVQKHDKIKNEYCKSNEMPLIRIPYWYYNCIEEYLFEKLVHYNVVKLIGKN